MDASVIVVGAGPAGLMLAGELRLAGADVIVLERLARPSGVSRALGLTIRTMEVFDQRGLLERFGQLDSSTRQYFGGVPVDLAALDSVHLGDKTVRQARIEEVLEGWATELGADIRRGHEVLSLTQRPDHVEVEVRGPRQSRLLRARHLVGCDGARSIVRHAAGFGFPGREPSQKMYVAEVRGVESRSIMRGDARVRAERVPGGNVLAYDLGEGVTRVFAHERAARPDDRTEPPAYAEVAAAWRRLTGEDISAGTPLWTLAVDDATRQATEYRRGRVLLAGHAAHVQVPAGGQGMHAGIQDSVNLGWKLGAVSRGSAPEALLDTYHGERHPVGRRLLTSTRAQALLFLDGEYLEPLCEVLTELAGYEAVNRHLARMVSGLDVHYDVGPGDHPLLGRRMPHRTLKGPAGRTSTAELLRPARGVLLDLADDAGLRRAAGAWADRVDTVTAVPEADGSPDPLGGTEAVLIRPDGHVAWVQGCPRTLPEALERWFGPGRGQDA
ncbi:FAD-dependent monooxygenase [Streptomyces sp. NPDC005017]|uniref:FAD-dependent monooxygenase n=1 Tax=Streptomyces sp. NPDC005017 TaxID=3364706 RepID=UPI0036CEAF62